MSDNNKDTVFGTGTGENTEGSVSKPKKAPLNPVVVSAKPYWNPSVQYVRNGEQERIVAENIQKKKRRPLIFILVVCVLLVASAFAVNWIETVRAGRENTPVIRGETGGSENVSVVIETPSPEFKQQTVPEEEPEPVAETAEPKLQHSYIIIAEDISWTDARQRCTDMGGHLVVISDGEELYEVAKLAEEAGVERVWIGCHRIDGELVWETVEEIDYYPWYYTEPSYFDGGDGVTEDYILMWNTNGTWTYNDSRNDPVADYPEMYSGNIAFICEFGD